jgi:hypothetical protein
MTIKSATPSGSQRQLVLVSTEAIASYIGRQPLPLAPELCHIALDLWLAACGGRRDAMPGRRALAGAWGIGERQARTIIEAWWAGRGEE